MIRVHQQTRTAIQLLTATVLLVLSTTGCQTLPAVAPLQTPASTATVKESGGPISDTVVDTTDTADQLADGPADAPLLDAVASVSSENPVTLTLWTVSEVSPEAEGDEGTIFDNGLKAFEEANPTTTVSVVLKNASGQGSVLDYLKTATQVAPSVLPDVVILNTTDMAEASRTGILVPLEDLIPAELSQDLLPTARAAGTVDEHLVGVPFEMDIEHIVYNTNKIATPPLNWTDVLSSPTTYMFPAKGRNGLVNDVFMVQYLALGGKLQDEEDKPFVNEQVLLTLLNYYQEGSQLGIFPDGAMMAGTVDEVWPEYVSAQIGIANVTSHLFLSDSDKLQATSVAAIPTHDGTLLTIGRGRVLAITTRDPVQQAAAVRLISWMLEPNNSAAWSETAFYLPTRYATFERLSADDPYWTFALQQLEVAVPAPSFSGYDQVGRVLQQEVTNVLTGEAAPEDAAAAAFDAIPR